MTTTESRDFRISNNMIFHLVFSQAGSVAKALGELVMNAHDAGASRFELTIGHEGFVARDNGRGFRSRQEIEDWFEELGFDHSDELHQEDGRFSRFGLGRAQCMAFAPTLWLTNTFTMSVDIKERGISYELAVDQPQVDGCTIQGSWYEVMSFADIKATLRELEELVAYAKIEIVVNGSQLNRTNTKWDYETDSVFVKRKETGPLFVYNKGILIRSYPSYQFGSGVVVSKVPFTLNIARNDILQSSCSVWKEVRAFLREEAVDRNKRKTRLNDDERQMLIDQLLSKEISYQEIQNSPLLVDVTGRKWKLEKIGSMPFTVHTSGAKAAADRIQQSKLAFVLAKSTLESFGVDKPESLIPLIEGILNSNRPYYHRNIELKFHPIEELLESNNADYVLLKPKELTKVEKVVLHALKCGFSTLQRAVHLSVHGTFPTHNRELFVGASDVAEGWTDGKTFVAIERQFLRKHARDGLRGFIALTNLLVHELCHEENSATGHDHGAEFYEAFHDVLCGNRTGEYGTSLRLSQAFFLKKAQKEGLKLSRGELRDLDHEVEIDREIYQDESFLQTMEELDVA